MVTRFMKTFSSVALALLSCAAPVFANVTVTSPAKGAKLVSPFNLVATASPCSSQGIASMGYSIDNSTNTTIVYGTSVNAQVTSPNGAHTLHVKSWGNQGASCVTDVAINVVSAPTASIPANAVAVKNLQTMTTWKADNDAATGNGVSDGTMSIVSTPSLSGKARDFAMTYSNSAGERYHVSFGADTAAHNFLYDAWIYLANPSSDIANLELDMNQVTSNGQTVIYGFQCDGYSSTWDYTENAGTPTNFSDRWLHSAAPCNPRNWSTNTWHHVQITYSRDDAGNVTYHSVWLDNVQQDINETVPSSFALGWGQTLLTNFQIDGLGGSGSVTTYIDNLTIYRW